MIKWATGKKPFVCVFYLKKGLFSEEQSNCSHRMNCDALPSKWSHKSPAEKKDPDRLTLAPGCPCSVSISRRERVEECEEKACNKEANKEKGCVGGCWKESNGANTHTDLILKYPFGFSEFKCLFFLVEVLRCK